MADNDDDDQQQQEQQQQVQFGDYMAPVPPPAADDLLVIVYTYGYSELDLPIFNMVADIILEAPIFTGLLLFALDLFIIWNMDLALVGLFYVRMPLLNAMVCAIGQSVMLPMLTKAKPLRQWEWNLRWKLSVQNGVIFAVPVCFFIWMFFPQRDELNYIGYFGCLCAWIPVVLAEAVLEPIVTIFTRLEGLDTRCAKTVGCIVGRFLTLLQLVPPAAQQSILGLAVSYISGLFGEDNWLSVAVWDTFGDGIRFQQAKCFIAGQLFATLIYYLLVYFYDMKRQRDFMREMDVFFDLYDTDQIDPDFVADIKRKHDKALMRTAFAFLQEHRTSLAMTLSCMSLQAQAVFYVIERFGQVAVMPWLHQQKRKADIHFRNLLVRRRLRRNAVWELGMFARVALLFALSLALLGVFCSLHIAFYLLAGNRELFIYGAHPLMMLFFFYWALQTVQMALDAVINPLLGEHAQNFKQPKSSPRFILAHLMLAFGLSWFLSFFGIIIVDLVVVVLQILPTLPIVVQSFQRRLPRSGNPLETLLFGSAEFGSLIEHLFNIPTLVLFFVDLLIPFLDWNWIVMPYWCNVFLVLGVLGLFSEWCCFEELDPETYRWVADWIALDPVL